MAASNLDLTVHFEPIVRLRDRRVVARELLVRPLGGGRLRDRVAEAQVDISWVTSFALSTAGIMLERSSMPMHVNVTPGDLARADFVDDLVRCVPRAALSSLILEITEDEPVTSSPSLDDKLIVLRRLGVRLAVDDFGDGYAGLTSVNVLRPEIIKVRLGLLHECGRQSLLARVLETLSIQAFAEVVVEQIETPDDLALAIELGFPLAQGWFWDTAGRPVAEPG